jgi:molybdopterin-biosynthesis enzyme MoeA-like protein
MSSAAKTVVDRFGLIIIGSEILDGRRNDSHFKTLSVHLEERGLDLAYSLVLPDVPKMITSQLKWAQQQLCPFFCCGGIGSTPDDYTRDCAAAAAGVPVEAHPEGVRLLRAKFGDDAGPGRMSMVDFPRGATLIPNPINGIPGFRIGHGHFVPGFPVMASPMMAWVLDQWFQAAEARIHGTLMLPGIREAEIVPLMQHFNKAWPAVRLTSLPAFTETGTQVELGLYGHHEDVASAQHYLETELTEAGIHFTS